jgi:signal transduction histidine kinase
LLDQHPNAAYAVSTFLLAAVCIGPDLLEPGRILLMDIALTLPLLARRRYPLQVLATILLIQFGHVVVIEPVTADIAVLAALYAVGRREPRPRWLALSAAAVATWAVVLMLTRAPAGTSWTDLVLLLGTVTAALALGINTRTRKAYLRSLLDRATALEHERDQQAVIAVAAERSRIAREMHDVVAHSLSVMIALSDGAAATAARDPQQAGDVMRQASSLGRQALAEMRWLLGVLRSDDEDSLAPQPGDRELVALVDRVRSAGLAVDLVVTGTPHQSPAAAQLAVHRIVQESLTNVMKHAPAATRATVRLNYAPGHIDVEVSNDDPRPAPASAASLGHGLTGMRERASVYGGTLTAGREPDGGWRVRARLELDDRRPA